MTSNWKWTRIPYLNITWWRHQMETFCALLAICAGNSPVPTQRPVTRSFGFFICARINGWVNDHEDGDLRHYRGHYDVTVMKQWKGSDMHDIFPYVWVFTIWNVIFYCLNSLSYLGLVSISFMIFMYISQLHWIYSAPSRIPAFWLMLSVDFEQSYLILSYLVSSRLTSSHLITSHLITSHHISSHLISSHLTPPHLISSHRISSNLISYPISSHLISSYLNDECQRRHNPVIMELHNSILKLKNQFNEFQKSIIEFHNSNYGAV